MPVAFSLHHSISNGTRLEISTHPSTSSEKHPTNPSKMPAKYRSKFHQSKRKRKKDIYLIRSTRFLVVVCALARHRFQMPNRKCSSFSFSCAHARCVARNLVQGIDFMCVVNTISSVASINRCSQSPHCAPLLPRWYTRKWIDFLKALFTSCKSSEEG